MKTYSNPLQALALTAALLSTNSLVNAADNVPSAGVQVSKSKLLTVNFEPRKVAKVEAGDFHFVPGQVAPIHTHAAPAVGYVAKGEILYQVEGEKPQLLREGDAFYEPAGKRILRFDNASATEEAIFIDFNLQQEGEPFIVFEKELTEHIDRRALPTEYLNDRRVNQVNIFASELEPNAIKALTTKEPALRYVAEGVVNLNIKGEPTQRIVAGSSFAIPSINSEASIANTSSEVPAKLITFQLH